jgi:prepilin-type N-terminal cleavage/methylation domain-containing protein
MDMKMKKKSGQASALWQAGFSLLELVFVVAILSVVLAAVFNWVSLVTQRSQSEQTKVDLTQEGREFVDEFERDLHQAGYPNCRMVATAGVAANCPVDNTTNPTGAKNANVAVGLVSVSNTQIIFEGDVDGNGTVDEIVYRLVDSAKNYPPTGTCPCTIQRSQVPKVAGTLPLLQLGNATFSQELQNVVNSGVPVGAAPYGGGLAIAGNTKWGATNTAYYAAISTFKDYPVFQAYDQNGNIIQLNPAVDISTTAGVQTLTCSVISISCVKSIRLTINLLANATTGVDLKTNTRPVTTLVGNARLVNN